MPEHEFQNGAVLDTRPEEEKAEDFLFEEVVASAEVVQWAEKPQAQWRKFPIFAQNGSGSCVAQTEAKEMGIMRWLKDGDYVHFSATDIYQRRINKPDGGMAAVDARKIVKNGGATLEIFAESQNLTDKQMDSQVIEAYKKEIGAVFKIPNYLALPVRDIETVASVIQKTGKGVMVWFYFEYREWTDVPEVMNPDLNLYAAATCRHSVTAVDFTMYKGKKALIIEDSWGETFGLKGQRIITEDFFNARNWYAGYLVNFRFDDQTQPEPNPLPQPSPVPTPLKPKYTFKKDLVKGDRNPDVKALQDILKYEGFYPKNMDSTGYYWSVTAKAVYDFQVKHKVAPMAELDSLKGNRVGAKTRAKLNELYS